MICVLALLPGFSTQADMYTQFIERIRTASTISGRVKFNVRTPSGERTYTETFAFKRPNLSRDEMWEGTTQLSLNVRDGKSDWSLDAPSNRLTQQPARPEGAQFAIPLLESIGNPPPLGYVARG